jgi:plastocyanin
MVYTKKSDKVVVPITQTENSVETGSQESTNVAKIPSDELAILSAEVPADQAKKTAYFDLVTKHAVAADKVDVTSCSVNPFVASIKKGTSITFTNKGSSAVSLNFGPGQDLVVAANSSKVFSDGFKHGAGVYGYGCATKSGAAGLILVL